MEEELIHSAKWDIYIYILKQRWEHWEVEWGLRIDLETFNFTLEKEEEKKEGCRLMHNPHSLQFIVLSDEG